MAKRSRRSVLESARDEAGTFSSPGAAAHPTCPRWLCLCRVGGCPGSPAALPTAPAGTEPCPCSRRLLPARGPDRALAHVGANVPSPPRGGRGGCGRFDPHTVPDRPPRQLYTPRNRRPNANHKGLTLDFVKCEIPAVTQIVIVWTARKGKHHVLQFFRIVLCCPPGLPPAPAVASLRPPL